MFSFGGSRQVSRPALNGRHTMPIERDGRGHLRTVSKPKEKGNHGRSRPTVPSYDRPTGRDPGRAPKASGSNHHPPSRDDGFYPLTREPDNYPPARDPQHDARPPGRPSSSANPAHRAGPPRFDEKKGVRRRSKELYEEASWDVSPDTGTEYPCTKRDLDACGGKSRGVFIREASGKPDHARMRAMFFPGPNTGSKVSIRQAALDIFQHNSLRRTPSAKEVEAINRLCIMIDNACHGFWGPDVAIKCFCDLDTVFFHGKLKGHVCITWAGPKEIGPRLFGVSKTLGHGHGKALIQLSAHGIFLDPGPWHERPLNQTLATILHEMCHAYQSVNCLEHGKGGYRRTEESSPSGGHGKCFGTMMHAVNARAFHVLGLKGDPKLYPYHDYKHGEGFP